MSASPASPSKEAARVTCDVPGKARFKLGHSIFEVDEKYEPLKMVGRGASSLVCSASDTVTGEAVAIKKCEHAFEDAVEARRLLRQMKLLRHLRHENIIRLKDVMQPADRGGYGGYGDVYLVYELMDTDLYHVIRSKQPLTNMHCRYFIYQ